MRRPSSKKLLALTIALTAARIGTGCEDEPFTAPSFDLNFDSGAFEPPSTMDGSLPVEAGLDGDVADADLADADVSDADVGDADVGDADVGDSDLADADLADADVSDADVSDAADAATETGDASAVEVVTTAPVDRRVGVGTASTITITFSDPMQPATVTVQAASGACTGSVRILVGPDFTTCIGATKTTTDDVTFTFTPAASLENEQRYKVAVTADALATDGRALTPYEMTTGFLTHKFPVDAKILYMANHASGDLGGVAGADEKCTTKPTRPAGVVSAKAMIAASTRTACSVANCGAGNTQVDWVLRPNQHYVREDGAYVFLTDANGIFTAYPGEHDLGSGLNFWDGLNANWTTRGPNCNDWTSPAGDGAVGWDVFLVSGWLTGGVLSCTLSRPFVCAEQ